MWLSAVADVTYHALTICILVYFMMSFTEYLHTVAYGKWVYKLSQSKWFGYIFAAFMGVIPGCVGAFASVTLYTHGIISLGAIVACMIATCGDEAFILLSLTPQVAIWLFCLLFALGIIAGVITDKVFDNSPKSCTLDIHQEDHRVMFTLQLSVVKVYFLSVALLLIALGFFTRLGGSGNFKIVFICLSFLHFALIAFSSRHFIRVHIMKHIVCKHLGKIFLWTWGFLLLAHFAVQYVDIASWISANKWLLLLLACIVGILPESGPNIIFVTLFYTQMLPFPILLANSIVQDGHGMLPLLAENKKDFILIKSINFALGLLVGVVWLFFWGNWM